MHRSSSFLQQTVSCMLQTGFHIVILQLSCNIDVTCPFFPSAMICNIFQLSLTPLYLLFFKHFFLFFQLSVLFGFYLFIYLVTFPLPIMFHFMNLPLISALPPRISLPQAFFSPLRLSFTFSHFPFILFFPPPPSLISSDPRFLCVRQLARAGRGD